MTLIDDFNKRAEEARKTDKHLEEMIEQYKQISEKIAPELIKAPPLVAYVVSLSMYKFTREILLRQYEDPKMTELILQMGENVAELLSQDFWMKLDHK